MLTIAPLCLLLCLFTMSYQAGAEHDEKAIRGLIDSFIDAWNRHDAHAFGTLFAEDADFTNWRGMGAKGRSKIEEFHAPIFATIFRNSHLGYTDSEIRFIRADVAAVDVRWEMTGALDVQGNPMPDRRGLLNFVMSKDAGQWRIIVMHNLDLTTLPPPSK
ncbi:MAG: SgcJ/EcaC family oxidoreductase [Candidatus Acidiferrum sp.]